LVPNGGEESARGAERYRHQDRNGDAGLPSVSAGTVCYWRERISLAIVPAALKPKQTILLASQLEVPGVYFTAVFAASFCATFNASSALDPTSGVTPVGRNEGSNSE
jgi:hypothetical protein